MLFAQKDVPKDSSSMSAFFLLLLHLVSAGIQNGNLVAALATALGISSSTVWLRNNKSASRQGRH
jgi:hypothetical protein